ncbi:RNA recognition domain-containing protein [Xylariomycetidae sp. FL2044]|nr:RNA recognition domain-containing protein [Xylariomycetidae sp. FL2044]
MSGKLDQSLDEILTTQRRAGPARRRTNRRPAGRPATTAPAGGVQKTSKQARTAGTKQAPAKNTGGNGESKVVVSNLPKDVNEGQIKEYFTTSIGPIKRVELSYGPNSVSRGIATVTFSKPDGASKAFNKLNGLLIDNRAIKVEIIVSAAKAAEIIPTKTLNERITAPKAQPKSAANDKKKEAGGKAVGSGARGRKRRGQNARPVKRTTEELDSEMADYWESAGNQNGAANGDAAAATNGDAMEEEILVCRI